MAEAEQRISDILTPEPFLKSMIGSLAGLSCGDTKQGVDADEWIAGHGWPHVGLELKAGASVWLYRNRLHQVVGFGSLGKRHWMFEGARTEIHYIPMLAVFKQYQGSQPIGAAKYCYQILDHLLDAATARIHESDWVGLTVRKSNAKAIHIYQRTGFVPVVDERKPDRSRMLLKLIQPTAGV